jgi:hypothetical protein
MSAEQEGREDGVIAYLQDVLTRRSPRTSVMSRALWRLLVGNLRVDRIGIVTIAISQW